jgi:L-lactate dehydrogenase complex protein LldG
MVAKKAETMNSRETMLARVKAALGQHQEPTPIPRAYRMQTDVPNLVDLFAERVAEYRAHVQRCTETELEMVLKTTLERLGVKRIAVPKDLNLPLPKHLEPVFDAPDLSAHDLEMVQAVLTTCAVGIAETGTIVLDHGAGQGRRILSLVPDVHICVVLEKDVVDNLPTALEKLRVSIDQHKPLTFISGPSATSDIELNRVEGVHGPRRLEVLVVDVSGS